MVDRAVPTRAVSVRSPSDIPSAKSSKTCKTSHDPALLREELATKHRLLNMLESRGIAIEHAHEVKARIEAALKDLDAIIGGSG